MNIIDSEKIQPVFITLFYSDKNIVNRLIKFYTKEEFSHAGISFDSSLTNIFSYNMDNRNNKFGGFSIENYLLNARNYDNTKLLINVIFLKKKYVDKMKEYIEKFKTNIKKTTYNFSHIFKIIFKIKDENVNSFNQICSEFTSNVFKALDISLIDKPTNLITPGDLMKIKNVRAFTVYNGTTGNYNPTEINKKIRGLLLKAKSVKESYDLLNENVNEDINILVNKYDLDNIYITSDWHLFKDKEENIKEFIEKQSKLLKGKLLIYLGDLGHRDNTSREKLIIQRIMSSINTCEKILVLGNHDSENYQYYYNCGFKYICNSFIFGDILFTHHPESIKDNKNIRINIHGHIHDDYVYGDCEIENHINVFNKERIPLKLSNILDNEKKLTDRNIEISYKIDKKELYELLKKYSLYKLLDTNNYTKILNNSIFNKNKYGCHFDFTNDLYKILIRKFPNSDIFNTYIEVAKGDKILINHSITFIASNKENFFMLDPSLNSNGWIYEGNIKDITNRISINLLDKLEESDKIGSKVSFYSYKPDNKMIDSNILDFIEYIKKNSLSKSYDMKIDNNLDIKVVDESVVSNDILLQEASGNTKRKKIENLIYNTFNRLDKTGCNTKKYKEFFNKMSDSQFDTYMKNFLNDNKKNFYLEITPAKIDPKLQDFIEALDYLGVPAEEYVYFRDKDGDIRTRYKVPVGYLNIKREQQMLSKKNTFSLDISKRSAKTNQVTGEDKIARISDVENYALSVLGADAALKEFLGPRADSNDAKMEMYKNISEYGYTYLKDLPNDMSKKQSINTIYQYLVGSGLVTDLIETPNDIDNDLNNLEKKLNS